jgi:hypothetical protein
LARTAPQPAQNVSGITLVNVMVQQIAERGSQARRSRVGVIAAEHGRHIGAGFEMLVESRERIRVHAYVGIDEDEDLATRGLGATIPGVGGAVRFAGQANDRVGPS